MMRSAESADGASAGGASAPAPVSAAAAPLASLPGAGADFAGSASASAATSSMQALEVEAAGAGAGAGAGKARRWSFGWGASGADASGATDDHASSASSDDDDEKLALQPTCAHDLWSVVTGRTEGSVRALWVVFLLTSGFTVAQFFGAYLANSLSMYGDSVTMSVDSGTYALNIFAERRKLARSRRQVALSEEQLLAEELAAERLDARVASVSVLSLVAVTLYIVVDAAERLHSEVGVDPVNPQIMLGFTSVNLVMNAISCSAFCVSTPAPEGEGEGEGAGAGGSVMDSSEDLTRHLSESGADSCHNGSGDVSGNGNGNGARHPRSESDADADADAAGEHDSLVRGRAGQQREQQHVRGPPRRRHSASSTGLGAPGAADIQENLNLLSAFVHLAADTLRSVTVFVTSLFVWTTGGDSVRADAVSSLIVCALIFLAAFFLMWETLKHVRNLKHFVPLTSSEHS